MATEAFLDLSKEQLMNKVVLIGNLTRDSDVRTTSSGVNVAQLGLAVSRRFANKEGVRETDSFTIIS